MIRKWFALEQLLMEGMIHTTITLANCFGINHPFCSRKESFSNNINIMSTFLKYSLKQSLKESLLLHHKIIFK